MFRTLGRPIYTGVTLAVPEGQDLVQEDPSKPVVICVDDDQNNLNALGRVLRSRCTVMLASSGNQALEMLEATPDVAAVLADLHMPGLPGAELRA